MNAAHAQGITRAEGGAGYCPEKTVEDTLNAIWQRGTKTHSPESRSPTSDGTPSGGVDFSTKVRTTLDMVSEMGSEYAKLGQENAVLKTQNKALKSGVNEMLGILLTRKKDPGAEKDVSKSANPADVFAQLEQAHKRLTEQEALLAKLYLIIDRHNVAYCRTTTHVPGSLLTTLTDDVYGNSS